MSLSNEKIRLLEQHVIKLNQKFPNFVCKQRDTKTVVIGVLPFCAIYNDKTIIDEYEIEILIPDNYPDSPPTVKEIQGKIPEDFHRNKDAGSTLCLGTPIAVARKFKENSNLLDFVEKQVVPFLFSYSYYKEHGEMPYGELPHGGEGIIKHYNEIFNINDDISVLGFLRILADNDYRGHHICPCGSNKKIRQCHGKILRDINEYQKSEDFLYEYNQVGTYIANSKKKIPESFISYNWLKSLKKRKGKIWSDI